MRIANWEDVLWAEVGRWRKAPFEWGVNDCCLFAARCVDAISGSDWVGDLRGCYHDERSALAYIKAEGGVEASVTRRLGASVPRLLARRGDVCLVETPSGHGLAVCVGGSVMIPGPAGLLSQALSTVLCAWRVD